MTRLSSCPHSLVWTQRNCKVHVQKVIISLNLPSIVPRADNFVHNTEKIHENLVCLPVRYTNTKVHDMKLHDMKLHAYIKCRVCVYPCAHDMK